MKFRKRVSILASMALVAPVIVASVATAELLPWDQEKVTAIAGELPPARSVRKVVGSGRHSWLWGSCTNAGGVCLS